MYKCLALKVLSRQMPLLAPALPVHRSVQYELLNVETAE